jgi:hypothetical protein
MRESTDGFVQRGGDRFDCQALESLHQRVTETVQTVTVAYDALALDIIQNLAHLLGRVLVMVQKRNKIRDGPLKVNVVFPERIIGVDEQRLSIIGIKTLSHNPNIVVMSLLIRRK